MRSKFTLQWCMACLVMLLSVSAFANHDVCSEAVPLECGDIITGSTAEATADEVPNCTPQTNGPSLWYSVVGTGAPITVSTCNPGTEYNTQLAVYSGSCTNLTCVGGNNVDFGCGINPRFSTVTFASTAGTTYYIYVTGQGGASGNFELSVECEEIPIMNDTCAEAEPVSCGDVVIASTVGAGNEPTIGTCGTTLTSAPGVWYSFMGDGSQVTVTTCGAATDYDTKLGVFSGSCGSLTCVGGDDDEGSCSFSSLQSLVTFESVAGTTYYFYVTGFSSNSGTFELSVSCVSAPDNDECVDAITVECGDNVTGSTQGASTSGQSTCGTSLNSSGAVWYELIGDNSAVTISTCNPGTDFDTKLGVFSGSCGSLTCVGGNDDQSGAFDPACNVTGNGFNRGSTVTFEAEAGVTYYIVVTGFSSNTGNFELSIDCMDLGPDVAYNCEDAIEIGCDDLVEGTTNGAPVNPDLGNCFGEDLDIAEGVWYSFQGNGLRIGVETLQEGTDYDPVLAVFEGSCGDLTCITANNNINTSTRMSRVEFLSTGGTTYYIYVTGQQGAEGDFVLSVDCTVPNDNCVDAVMVDCNSSIIGSTVQATSDTYPACGTSFSTARGVWYSFIGSGTATTLTTCNAGTNYDTKLFLFEGACGALSCVAGNDDDFDCPFSIRRSTIDFESEEGVLYYVLVTGFGSSNGDFELSITCEGGGGGGGGDCTDNDNIYDNVCDADCLTLGEGYPFSNAGATVQPGEVDPGPGASCNATDGWCSFEPQPFLDNTVWFRFIAPPSGCVSLVAIDADMQMAVWQTSDCSDFSTFVEIAANDDSGPGFSPQLDDLAVNPGETYWVQIDGYNGALETAGTITVTDCDAPVPGCDDALELLCGDVVTGSTVGEPTRDLTCVTTLNTSGGVFYRFTGVGETVTVSTCNPGSNYDTKLGVFSGSCGSLTCEGGNDDQTGGFDPACDITNIGVNRGSTVTFFAATGTDYFIYVTGFAANTGTYELSVDCTTSLNVDPGTRGTTTLGEIAEVQVGNPYPNPTQTGEATIDIDMPTEGTSIIRIIDQLGRLAQQTEVDMYAGSNRVNLDVADLAAGTYFVNITIDGKQYMKKLAIVR